MLLKAERSSVTKIFHPIVQILNPKRLLGNTNCLKLET